MENLHLWISQYGYLGIFSLLMLGILGLPVPDETLLTLSGYLVFHGELKLFPTFLAAYLGSIAGISISYAIGSTFGHHILVKYGHYIHITNSRLEKIHLWFEKFGRWSLPVGYFIPGVRHVVALLAGASKLQMWEFALFAYSGGLIWAVSFLSVGYFFGKHSRIVLHSINQHIVLASIIAGVVLIFFYIFKNLLYKKINNIKKS
jgi:membrane protein DedA with SNARE-associated domain